MAWYALNWGYDFYNYCRCGSLPVLDQLAGIEIDQPQCDVVITDCGYVPSTGACYCNYYLVRKADAKLADGCLGREDTVTYPGSECADFDDSPGVAAGITSLSIAAEGTATEASWAAAFAEFLAETVAVGTSAIVVATSLLESDQPGRCRETHPTWHPCVEDEEDIEEVAQWFLNSQGVSMEALGDCAPDDTFGGLANIVACESGSGGVTYHCKVAGRDKPLSIFGCSCCDSNNKPGMNWRSPHWSNFFGKRPR